MFSTFFALWYVCVAAQVCLEAFLFLFLFSFLFLFVRANSEANLAAAFNLRAMLHAAAVEGADEEDDEV